MGATLGFVVSAAWPEFLFAPMLINSKEKMTLAVGGLIFSVLVKGPTRRCAPGVSRSRLAGRARFWESGAEERSVDRHFEARPKVGTRTLQP